MKMENAVDELRVNTALYAGYNVTISEQAARGVLRYINSLEKKCKSEYQRALDDINKGMEVITENWNPSKCPRCKRSFSDYEPCDDGYYDRATNLERCPYCGQKLDWPAFLYL